MAISAACASGQTGMKQGRMNLRSAWLVLALAGAPVAAFAVPAPVSPNGITVAIDHAKIVRVPENAQTIVVGNPSIADVTVQKNGILVVTGKSYGVTNLIALDGGGNMIVEANIRVEASNDSLVTVHRGLERESYSCGTVCQPSVLIGDAKEYFNEAKDQAAARTQLAAPK